MFIRKSKKRAQTTAEYAVLIALVISAVLAMQVFVGRALKGRIADEATALGRQYEPYYLYSHFDTTRDTDTSEATLTGGGVVRSITTDDASRTGWQESR